MTLNLSVSPDFPPTHLSGWFIFNTWLQRQLNTGVHLELYDSFDAQREDIRNGKIDLIYANPYDASMLVRELGFKVLVRPRNRADETVIAARHDDPRSCVEDLGAGINIATTADPDVHTMGMIMLESADLDKTNVSFQECDSYVLVAKALLNGQADAGFFLKDGYDELSELVRHKMKMLVSSQISVVHHTLVAGPRMQEHAELLTERLLGMEEDPKGRDVLKSMGLDGWDVMEDEQTEFMIDLIDTLID
ncbi:MAG: phosphate/phosphite/phosphonate ABC transporter substrate-binding protein [Oceanospirillales bacterium]|uniref:Phosphonate transport system substrate-binding protein n=1 Tax=Marinobacterium halophilum TaxID=267374 RepID=A0A2P8EZN3_9GAMM|nr:phosphate/phosphite/phosphonate ABC transporter substrate-binding protein [Marinobacterium halophilum]MBR9828261.1 phosphate/phosphite/phosphonate ABC transporter substrate-binding protein [Oceanospirillales bacterium]PSL14919.1 phosphonate transport system substrate-binding protein [Marinobacterium halophilum]